MEYTNKEKGLYDFDLSDPNAVDVLSSAGLDIFSVKLDILRQKSDKLISDHLEGVAFLEGYASSLSFVSYVSDPSSPFYEEALKFSKYRSDVWIYAISLLDDFNSGKKVLPSDITISDFDGMPKWEDYKNG